MEFLFNAISAVFHINENKITVILGTESVEFKAFKQKVLWMRRVYKASAFMNIFKAQQHTNFTV